MGIFARRQRHNVDQIILFAISKNEFGQSYARFLLCMSYGHYHTFEVPAAWELTDAPTPH